MVSHMKDKRGVVRADDPRTQQRTNQFLSFLFFFQKCISPLLLLLLILFENVASDK